MPTIYVTHFDLTGDGHFLPILSKWKAHYDAVACSIPVRVLTDSNSMHRLASGMTRAPTLDKTPMLLGMECHVVLSDMIQRDVCRPGNVYDYKSALICAALPYLPEDSIIMDSDALIMRDITTRFDAFHGEPFAMPPDSGRRRIPWSGAHGPSIMEHSSSVLFFGDKSEGMRELLVENYRRAWLWLDDQDDAKGQIKAIREQRAWSLAHWWTDAPLMSEDLNWSHNYRSGSDAAYVIHHHGAGKLRNFR